MAKVTSKVQREIYLKEYEICFENATKKDSLVWTTFSGIALVSVAAVLAVAISETLRSWAVATFVGVVVVSLSWIWFNMVTTWWHEKALNQLRMRHIEEDLGMFMNRYLESKSGTLDLSKASSLSFNRKKEVEKDVQARRTGLQRHLMKFLPIVSFVWCSIALFYAIPFIVDVVSDYSNIEKLAQGLIALIFTALLLSGFVSILRRVTAWMDEMHGQDREAFPGGKIPRKRPFFLYF